MQDNSQNQEETNQENSNLEDNNKFQQRFASNKSNQNEAQQEQNQEISSEDKIKELEQKLANANDRALRALAELENNRRSSKAELEKTIKFGISRFANDLIVVCENFFLASNNAPKQELEANDNLKNYFSAMSMTQNELVKVLEKNGVKRIYPLGEKFDHNFHEALSQIESDKEQGTVLDVIQAGYALNDRLLKPALVAVAK